MAEARKTRIGSSALWIAAGIALILIFFGVQRFTRQKLRLRVAESQVQDLVKTTSTNGKVEPQPEVNFEAHAPEAGLVSELYVHPGEHVLKGKLLLRLQDTDAQARLATASAALRGAEASLQTVQAGGSQHARLALLGDIAKAKLERDQAASSLATIQKLEAQGAAAPSEVAQARQRFQIADTTVKSLEQQKSEPFAPADLAHAQSAVAEAQAGYAAAVQVISQSNVISPISGTVYSLPVSRYEYVQPGTQLVEVADLAKLRVRAYFDEPEIGDLQLNNPVTIVWDAKPGRTWHGRITGLPSTIITYGTRNVGEVLVSVDDSDGTLLPNTNVTVTVITRQVRNALTVPREALHIEDGLDYVYVVSGNTLRRQRVVVGELNLTEVQILSGLQVHTVVALGTTNGAPISEGVPIEIVNRNA
jgi:HlyD family secretion protein